MDIVDLRSDTVTHPTPAMRQAMAAAPVGDDVYGEDPTVNRLQALAAERLGKEAGLFVPSGTMGNLIAILTHCSRGDEAIMGNLAHTFLFEAAGAAALGGVQAYPIPNQPDGTLDLNDIRRAIRSDDIHHPITRLVLIENTQNWCGGVPLIPGYTQVVGDLAHARGLKLHLDGARLFNAAIAQGVAARDLAAPVDSVTFCLSKGMCAPVGSVLCGTQEFIDRARRTRKQLGGGMRQAGILAAAGIVALEEMVDRLAEDHARLARLAAALDGLGGLVLPHGRPRTNILFVDLPENGRYSETEAAARLEACGVRVDVEGPLSIRLVTHHDVDDLGLERAIEAFQNVFGENLG